jgi:hypothetical protein
MDTFEKAQELKALLVSAGRGEARTPEDEELYKQLRDELLQIPDIRPLVPAWLREYRGIREFWPFIKSKSPTYAGRQEFLRQEFEAVLSYLEAVRMGTSASPQQFFPAGSDHEAYVQIRKIIETARTEIRIVDPYVDHTLWTLLTNVPPGTPVYVLTQNMNGDFLLEAQKFAKQHGSRVEVRSTRSFHDRFVVIDGSQCWHLGASIKDAGAKAFLISEIQSDAIRKATISVIESEWQSSTPLL